MGVEGDDNHTSADLTPLGALEKKPKIDQEGSAGAESNAAVSADGGLDYFCF